MSDIDIELNGADQTASTEAKAANAANDVDTSEENSLVDYNEDDEVEAAQKAADQKALKEMLANNENRESEAIFHFPIFERIYNVSGRHTFGNTERRPT